jgi:hypothetical protein
VNTINGWKRKMECKRCKTIIKERRYFHVAKGICQNCRRRERYQNDSAFREHTKQTSRNFAKNYPEKIKKYNEKAREREANELFNFYKEYVKWLKENDKR